MSRAKTANDKEKQHLRVSMNKLRPTPAEVRAWKRSVDTYKLDGKLGVMQARIWLLADEVQILRRELKAARSLRI